MKAMIVKEFRELMRDRRTVVLLVAAPLLLLIIFGYAANFSIERNKVLVGGPGASRLETQLKSNSVAAEHIDVVRSEPQLAPSDIEKIMRKGTYDAVIYAKKTHEDDPSLASYTHIWVDGSKLFAAQAATGNWMKVVAEDTKARVSDLRSSMDENRKKLDDMRENLDSLPSDPASLMAASRHMDPQQIKKIMDNVAELKKSPPEMPNADSIPTNAMDPDSLTTVLYNPDLKTSWVMIPALIGLILAFIGTIITSIGMVREREAGTLEQLAVMPLRPSAIILGKIAPYFLLAVMDIVIITIVGVEFFDVPFRGSVVLFGAISLVFLFVVLGLGVLISSMSHTTGEAVQMAMMTMMPQVLLSGFIFPLDAMPKAIAAIGYILPLTWFNICAQGVMLRDATWSETAFPLGVLVVIAVVIFGAATLRMRRLLTTGGAVR